jgi:hypothetical protein
MPFVRLLTVAVMGLALFQVCCRRVGNGRGPTVALAHIDFHGWEAIALRNQTAEVVVVPAEARVEFGASTGPVRVRGAESPAGRGP